MFEIRYCENEACAKKRAFEDYGNSQRCGDAVRAAILLVRSFFVAEVYVGSILVYRITRNKHDVRKPTIEDNRERLDY